MLKPIKVIIYVIFISLAAFFLSGMIKEYLEDNTSFSITQQSMSKEDLPTVTMCLKSESSAIKMRYGRDLTIQTIDSKIEPWLPEANATIRTLIEGNNDYGFMGQKRLTTLEQLRVSQQWSSVSIDQTCIKMKLNLLEKQVVGRQSLSYGTVYDMGMFIITLSEEIADTVQGSTLFITSENNSYGVVLTRWLDGNVQPFQLKRGGLHDIMITNVKRYQYLKENCQSLSFYGCLGQKLTNENICKIKGTSCSPISTPVKTFPLCPLNMTFNDCKYTSLTSDCMEKLPCITEEYTIQEDEEWSGQSRMILKGYINNDDILNEIADRKTDKFLIWLEISTMRWTTGLYTSQLMKEVHREYLVWSDISMIGNVGGQLGLWLGFSFTGFMVGILNLTPKIGMLLAKMMKKAPLLYK